MAFVWVATIVLAVVCRSRFPDQDDPVGLTTLGLLMIPAALAGTIPVHVTTGTFQFNLRSFPVLLSAVVLGPWSAAAIGVIGALVSGRSTSRFARLLNLGMAALSGLSAGVAFQAAGGTHALGTSGRSLLLELAVPLIAAMTSQLAVNAGVLAGAQRIGRASPFLLQLRVMTLTTIPVYLVYAAVAFVLVVVWELGGLNWFSVILVVVPILVARSALARINSEHELRRRGIRGLVSLLELRHPGTAGHSQRVATIARMVAETLGLSPRDLQSVYDAALLHDVGLLRVPRSGNHPEFAGLLVDHPSFGAGLIESLSHLAGATAGVRHHHERVDGSGYPKGLRGEAIPLSARIVAVAESYDYVRLGGPERRRDSGRALAVLRQEAQNRLDATVLDALAKAVARHEGELDAMYGAAKRLDNHIDDIAEHDKPTADAQLLVGSSGLAADRGGSTARVIRSARPADSDREAPERSWRLTIVAAAIAGLIIYALAERGMWAVGSFPPWLVALIFTALIVGDQLRAGRADGLALAPLGAATAIGALLWAPLHGEGVAGLLTLIGIALLVEIAIALVSGDRPDWGTHAAFFLGLITVAVIMYRPLMRGGESLYVWLSGRSPITVAAVWVFVGLVGRAVTGAIRVVMSWRSYAQPWRRALGDELVVLAPVHISIATTAALMATAAPFVGVLSLVGLLPLGITLLGSHLARTEQATYRETIIALSQVTDAVGLTRPGHAARVAAMALQIGRKLQLTRRELADLENAALLHDLGQVALSSPLPGGATISTAPAVQQRIADDGARVIISAGLRRQSAELIESQYLPYRQVRVLGQEVPIGARILKVANAYDDLSEGLRGPDVHAAVMERIHLGLGYEYDPGVVAIAGSIALSAPSSRLERAR